jgi:hypothetical protein
MGEVRIFPNPTTGEVRWSGLPEGVATVRVYNQWGSLVLERDTDAGQVDLGNQQPGLYMFCFQIGRHCYFGKVVKY